MGYEIVLAFDGQAGLAAFVPHQPDLVLLDWMMPVINGIDLCREIRQRSDVPIIMLMAKGEETDKIGSLVFPVILNLFEIMHIECILPSPRRFFGTVFRY